MPCPAIFLWLLVAAALLVGGCGPDVPTADGGPTPTPAIPPSELIKHQQAAAANAFKGADCYGDRLDACLNVNPAAQALAQDPALCQGQSARVCVVPTGFVRADVLKAIVDFHKTTKGIDVVILPSLPLDASEVDYAQSQVTVGTVYRKMQAAFGVNNRTPSTYIGITSIDARPDDSSYGWEFGYRTGSGPFGNRHGVFSYFRMVNVPPYDGKPITDDLIRLRVAKYTARYTALLYLHAPVTDDRQYLNYRNMYGFSDLDSMGLRWPDQPVACAGDGETICIVPDGRYESADFRDDVKAAVARLAKEGLPVEMLEAPGLGFYPTQPDWGAEFSNDLRTTFGELLDSHPKMTVVGVTDDSFSHDAAIPMSFEVTNPGIRVVAVSAGDAGGTVGTPPHQERLYRLILRAILREHFQQPLVADPMNLMWEGATRPADLDGKAIPSLPK